MRSFLDEQSFKTGYLILRNVLNITLSNFGFCVPSIFFYNLVDFPSGNMAYNSNSATSTVLQDGLVEASRIGKYELPFRDCNESEEDGYYRPGQPP